MEISVEITQEDYLDFNKFYFFKKKSKQRIIRTAVLAIIIAVVSTYEYPFDLALFIAVVLLAFVVQLLFIAIFMPILVRVMGYVPAKNGVMLGKKTFRVTMEGLSEESENTTVFQKWKSIKSVDENKRSIFIFVDTIAAYIVPKRYFQNEEHLEEFKRMVYEYASSEGTAV